MGGYGNLVVVDHGNGLATAYGHNTSVVAGVGSSVAQGQLIAYSGNTGNSTGPHVHFEVRVNGAAVDPLGYL
jgi:murein DD-endopeptidase MepM/ murein hydrolase activator NlpD